MSDMAIAAVTATLRSLLQATVQKLPGGGTVTTLPPDKAEGAGDASRLNLFLYQTTLNGAWRNQSIPTRTKPGETSFPPLPLNLHYLVTAYGDSQDDEADHRLLGAAMRTLHDYTVLKRQDIRDATSLSTILKDSALDEQFEPVRIVPELLSVEEMSKLWTTFQAKYRISAAYQASVVLIESTRPVKTPLPVLRRGEEDRGADVAASLPSELTGIEYRDLRTTAPAFPAAQLGEIITLRGSRLPGTNCLVVFRNPFRPTDDATPNANVVARLTPEPDSDDERIYVNLAETAGNWVAGPLLVALEEKPSAAAPTSNGALRRPASTNTLQFALAPILHDGTSLSAVTAVEKGRRKLVFRCRPSLAVRTDGRLPETALLLSPIAIGVPPQPIAIDPTSANLSAATPVFDIDGIPAGEYRVRLRIETVESIVMARDGARIDFDERQKVRI